MKNIRYVLYAALVVISMMLWNAWEKENVKNEVIQEATQPEVIQKDNLTTNNNYSFHGNVNHQVHKISSPLMNQTSKNRIIHVKTDVLDFNIDKSGGNFIHDNLPEYTNSLEDKSPVELLNQNEELYYIAESGLVLADQDIEHQPILYQSSQDNYQLAPTDKNLIIKLTAKDNGLEITKTLTFEPKNYSIKIDYSLHNSSNKPWVGSDFMQFIRNALPPHQKGILGFNSFFGIAISSPGSAYQKYTFKKLSENPVNQTTSGGWIAMDQHYFLGAWVPNKETIYRYYSKVTADGMATVGMIGPKMEIQPGQTVNLSSVFYTGPKIATFLDQLSPKLWLTIDFGWLGFISIIIFKALKWINSFVGNWGWSIIILTILIKLIFYHLSATSYKSMAGMRKLQPKISRLKEQYVDDKQGMSKAMMALYKQEKINPLGGCLPILIQIPVFIALYYVLLESVELRQAPFIFWIHDLSLKDAYYILPILMGISMYLQQKLSPAPPDAAQAKMMMFLPVIMTVFFLNFPAGLVLYWLTNNVVSVLQQWYITKRYESGAYDKNKKLKWKK